ncbi:MAG TPA: cytochrome c [Bryobacteraceae bacterium]|nr:cytochrome c [Bryobacteraceae bacterium]
MIKAAIILALAALAALAQEKLQSVWDGVYTEQQASRGRVHYDAKCAECHGDELEGDVVEAPALCGSEFLWKFNGVTLDHIFERVHRDMPLTRSGTLSKQVSADIVAYMLSASSLPAGRTELPPDEHRLKRIRIDAEKPK